MNAKILIVEDEMLVAVELEAIVEDLGHRPVGIASDVESALSLAGTRPDLALVDLNLRDGHTGPKIGAQLSREHDIAVVFVTANPRELGDGIDGTIGVLTKPTNERMVTAAIEYALQVHWGDHSATPPPSLRVFKETD